MRRFIRIRKAGKLLDAIRIDEGKIRGYLEPLVKSSVEETLNGLQDVEEDSLCCTGKFDRRPERVDTRSGSQSRKLHSKAGEVTLQEDKENWQSIVWHLKSSGLSGVRLVVSDKCFGLVEAVSQ